MIKSMTGFGRGEYSDGKRNIIVEIRTVNHRYSDISVRMPRRYTFAEEKIKAAIKETVNRGKMDVSVIVENLTEDDVTVKLNLPVAKQYYDNLRQLKDEFDVTGDISLQFLSTLPDVMKAAPDIEDEEKVTASLIVPVKMAVENLDKMRCIEGEKLAEDLVMRGHLIADMVSEIEEYAPQVAESYMTRLKEKITDLIGNSASFPEDRILAEAAIFADKSNITEEIVRLKSHIRQLENIISGNKGETVGKKLDFLVQEMNREANTIGTKANFLDITNTVLDIKSEIEKIREQVQNIE